MAQLKPWGDVQSSPQYQQADEATKAKIQGQYTAAGGTIEQAPAAPAEQPSSGIAEDIGNTLVSGAKGAAAGLGHSIAKGAAGLVGFVGEGLSPIDRAVTGNPEAESMLSTYSRRMKQRAEDVYQRNMQEASAGGHETAAKVGETVGQIGGDIAAMVAAPGAAIPGIAARELGRAYADEGNMAGAVGVGAANYVAGRILPGAGGEVAEGLINRGIASAKTIAKNALAGAKGGGLVGTAEALNRDDVTAGKVIGGAIEGAGTGAAFGGGIGAAHSAVGAVARRVSGRTAKAASDVVDREVPPEMAPDVAEQGATIESTATPAERADAYKNAGAYRSVKGSAALEARGIPLTDARLGYSPDAMAAHGKTIDQVQASRDVSREGATNAMLPFGLTNSEAAGKMAVAKSQWEKGGRQLVDDMKGSLESGQKSIANFKNDVQEEFASRAGSATTAEKQANTEQMASINRFQKDYANYQSAMNNMSAGDSVRTDNLLDLAARARESHDAMPDYFKEQFAKDYQDVGEGFSKGFDPVEHAATYNDSFNQLKEMHPSFRNATTAPSQGAVKGTPQPSLLGMAKATLDAFGSNRARSKMVAEQEANAAQARQLAAGLANQERVTASKVESARANMENPVVNDGTQEQLRFSSEEAAAPPPTPEPPVGPDMSMARNPRPRTVDEPVPPVEDVAPPVEPEVAPTPDQLMTQQPRPRNVEETAPPVEETPVVAEETTPAPDMTMAREPTRPVAEETTAPVEETTVTQPDRVLAETPRQPERPPVEEPVVEAPVESPVTPEPVSEPLPAAKPKAREKVSEAAPEPVKEEVPLTEAKPEDASTLSKHLQNVAKRQIDIVKKMFTTKKIQDKVNIDNMNNPNVLQRLKREDVAANTDALTHASEQAAIAKLGRESGTHKANVAHLERWSKDTGIAWKYIDEAIQQKGLQKSNLLGVNDIQVRATKAWQRDLDAAKLPKQEVVEKEVKAQDTWNQQRDKFYDEVTKMHPDVRAKAMQMIDQSFKASAKTDRPLTDSDVHGLWNKIYNHEGDIHAKAAREAEAAVAKQKAEDAKTNAEKEGIQKKADAETAAQSEATKAKVLSHQKLQNQMEDIRNKMIDKLKGKDIPEREINEFVDSHMDDKFGALETPLSDVRHNSGRSSAADAAEKFADKYHKSNAAEIEEMKAGGKETEETKVSKQVFNEVKDNVGGSTVDKVELENHLAEELIDRSEAAFREGTDVAAVEKASRDLMKAYKMDPSAATSIRQYPKVIAKAANMRTEFPDNPEVWLSQTDVDSLAKAGRVNADGMKAKITDTVIGKRYDSVKLLTDKERDAVIQKLRNGDKVDVKIDKGRRGALTQVAEQEAKAKATVKKAKPKAPKPEKTADEKEVDRLKRRLFGAKSEDLYRNMKGNMDGQIYKADLSRYNYLKGKISKTKK